MTCLALVALALEADFNVAMLLEKMRHLEANEEAVMEIDSPVMLPAACVLEIVSKWSSGGASSRTSGSVLTVRASGGGQLTWGRS